MASGPEGKGRWPACAKPLRRRQGRDLEELSQRAKWILIIQSIVNINEEVTSLSRKAAKSKWGNLKPGLQIISLSPVAQA
ncbi:MAG: hypothetical protein A2V86_00720 [Deltaproteobacteria bacterium RBG_16_49_23]|nr:MAG: hypothetical protein A2V86_00720 [Deltaproteobacteria bacterium RBG_16_49_23]